MQTADQLNNEHVVPRISPPNTIENTQRSLKLCKSPNLKYSHGKDALGIAETNLRQNLPYASSVSLNEPGETCPSLARLAKNSPRPSPLNALTNFPA